MDWFLIGTMVVFIVAYFGGTLLLTRLNKTLMEVTVYQGAVAAVVFGIFAIRYLAIEDYVFAIITLALAIRCAYVAYRMYRAIRRPVLR